MLKSFSIENYKVFNEFKLDNLSHVNIFFGKNNVGKTTILESIFGFASGSNFTPIFYNSMLRIKRGYREEGTLNLYNSVERILNSFNKKEDTTFKFSGVMENGEKKIFEYKFELGSIFSEINPTFSNSKDIFNEGIEFKKEKIQIGNTFIEQEQNVNRLAKLNFWEDEKLKYSENIFYPFFNIEAMNYTPYKIATYLDILNHRSMSENSKIYAHLKRNPSIFKEFLEELQRSFPNLENIDMFPYPDGSPAPVSVKMKDKDYLPLSEFGDGMQRWFNLIGNSIIYSNAILCLEEIGATLHHEAQGSLGYYLTKTAYRQNNQLFITSHSEEFVINYLEKIREENIELLTGIRVITLKNIDGNIKTRVLSGDEALTLLIENEMKL